MSDNNTADCSTPVTENKKRELSSPLDYMDTKKSKMAESQIILSSEDIQSIANVLRDTFRSELPSHRNVVDVDTQVQAIVDGVLAGLNTKIRHLEEENDKLRTRVSKLERDADIAEQYSRRNCLRFSGIPEVKHTPTNSFGHEFPPLEQNEETAMINDNVPSHNNELTDGKILEIANALDLDVHISDIDRSHRVGQKKDGKPRDIIVKFSSYRVRNAVYRARVGLKNCGHSGVFINEDLTRMRSALFFKARQLVKGNHLVGAWTYDGTVMVKDSVRKIHRITSENDLMKVKSPEPIPAQPQNRPDSTLYHGADVNLD